MEEETKEAPKPLNKDMTFKEFEVQRQESIPQNDVEEMKAGIQENQQSYVEQDYAAFSPEDRTRYVSFAGARPMTQETMSPKKRKSNHPSLLKQSQNTNNVFNTRNSNSKRSDELETKSFLSQMQP